MYKNICVQLLNSGQQRFCPCFSLVAFDLSDWEISHKELIWGSSYNTFAWLTWFSGLLKSGYNIFCLNCCVDLTLQVTGIGTSPSKRQVYILDIRGVKAFVVHHPPPNLVVLCWFNTLELWVGLLVNETVLSFRLRNSSDWVIHPTE